MHYRFEFHPYQRRFKSPLQTSHGIWDVRDGIILRLSDGTGLASYGEIAPISWFGSESLEQALDFCRQLPTEITEEVIFSIPGDLPACQFGFESALEAILRGQGSGIRGQGLEEQGKQGEKFPASPRHRVSVSSSSPLASRPSPLTYSGLLPAGEAALQAWQSLWDQGYRTFKWKIGVYPIADELEIFKLLTQALPVSAKLRLDANGGLTDEAANLWLWSCDKELSSKIEFIEQPLPVEKFTEMLELSSCYATPIALDESVATLAQLQTCYQQDWREIFVIKAAIAGSPRRLRQFCQAHKIDAVFSSVFETAVGRLAALNLAAELSQNNRAVGFGVNHWFDDDNQTWLEQLWKDQ
jgi:O-succinylbenzoate synthase